MSIFDEGTSYYEQRLEVVVPCGKIPDGARVRKLTGTVEYVLKTRITVYNHAVKGAPMQVLLEGGVYLLGERGDINQQNPEKPLVWITTLRELNYMAEENK